MLEEKRVAQFESFVTGFMEQHQLPGAAVALAQGERVIYCKGFGYRDLERGLPATTDTIFGIASITKSFTAMAVGKLVELGKLSFDDPVSKHLPGFRLPGSDRRDVTVRHLLTHTSGMPALDALGITFRSHSGPDPVEPPPQQLARPPINTYPELIDYIARFPGRPLGGPGEYFNYSNEAYALLGALVRRVSGMPYAAFVRKHIIEPLGMHRTTYSFEEMYEHDEVTVLYTRQADGTLQASTRWPCAPAFQAAGRIKSTVEDLIRPFQMYAHEGRYQGKEILSAGVVKETTAPHHKYSLHEFYGHALHVRPGYHGVTLISHGGAGKGISSHGGFVPEKQLSAVVLTNLGGVPVIQLWGALVNLGLGLPLETPRAEYTITPWPQEVAERFCGRYASAEGNAFTITMRDANLLIESKTGVSEIVRVTDEVGVYKEKGLNHELRFYTDRVSGEIAGVGRGSRFIPRVH